jgi:hypothetical protein
MPNFSAQYAHIINNAIASIGPLPYIITSADGSAVYEAATMTDEQLAAEGWLQIEQRGQRDFDPDIEVAIPLAPVLINNKPVVDWTYHFTPTCRDAMIGKIDEQAEVRRAAVATSAPLQVKEYDEAYDEAMRYMAASPEDQAAGSWPFLSADIGVTQFPDGSFVQNHAHAAGIIIATREVWREMAAEIRAQRLAAKSAIRNAPSDAAAHAHFVAAWAS